MKKLILILLLIPTLLIGQTEMIVNGNFDDATGWTTGLGWTIGGGVATFDTTGFGNDGSARNLSQSILNSAILPNTKYTIKFKLITDEICSFRIQSINATDTYVDDVQRTGGLFNFEFTTGADIGDGGIRLYTSAQYGSFSIDSISLKATAASPYYVAVNGDDFTGNGSISNPWATWKRSLLALSPSDTLYLRGGVYNFIDDGTGSGGGISRGDGTEFEGTKDKPTCILGYPGEKPILDMTNSEGDAIGYNYGLGFDYCVHLKLKNFTIRNLRQTPVTGLPTQIPQGLSLVGGNNWTVEDVTLHDIWGRGMWATTNPDRTDSSYYRNIDIYNCIDPYSKYIAAPGDTANSAGNAADGAMIIHWRKHPNPDSLTAHEFDFHPSYALIDSCRFWKCSDDLINLSGNAVIEIRNTWFFKGDMSDSVAELEPILGHTVLNEGNGIKQNFGLYDTTGSIVDTIARKTINCIFAYTSTGVNANNGDIGWWPRSQVYNCTFYEISSYGLVIQGMQTVLESYMPDPSKNVYKNTLVYNAGIYDILNSARQTGYNPTYRYEESYNTWRSTDVNPYYETNPNYTLTVGDFVAGDSVSVMSELMAPRDANNKLPAITSLRLASDSDLKGAGTDVGMSTTPDIGVDWAYLDAGSTPADPPSPRKRPAGTATRVYGGGDVIYEF